MVSYFTSRLYFHEPKASENTAYTSEMTHHIPRMKSVINLIYSPYYKFKSPF